MFCPKILGTKHGDTQIAITSIRELVLAYGNGYLIPYENNRGDVGVSNSSVKKIAEKFDPKCVGELTVAEVKEGIFQLGDGHTRMEAIELVAQNLNAKILNADVSLQIVPEKDLLKIYAATNSGKGHTGRMKITNKDYLLGNLGKRIISNSGVPDAIKSNFQQSMWDTIIAFNINGDSASLTDTFKARHVITKEYQDVMASSGAKFPISLAYQHKASKGLKFYSDLIAEYTKHLPRSATTGKVQRDPHGLANSPGLFMTVLFDYLRENPIIVNRSPVRLAKAMFEGAHLVEEGAESVARRSTKKVNLKKLLKGLGIRNVTPTQQDDWVGI